MPLKRELFELYCTPGVSSCNCGGLSTRPQSHRNVSFPVTSQCFFDLKNEEFSKLSSKTLNPFASQNSHQKNLSLPSQWAFECRNKTSTTPTKKNCNYHSRKKTVLRLFVTAIFEEYYWVQVKFTDLPQHWGIIQVNATNSKYIALVRRSKECISPSGLNTISCSVCTGTVKRVSKPEFQNTNAVPTSLIRK